MKLAGIILLIVGLTMGVRTFMMATTRDSVRPAMPQYGLAASHKEVVDIEGTEERQRYLIIWGVVSLAGLVLLGVSVLATRPPPE